MKVGVQISSFSFTGRDPILGEHLKKIAVAADNSGFDSIWVMDHFFQIPFVGDYTEPMLEAYTALGYIAGVTKHAKLGTMVTGVIYRDPAVLLKAVTTLDVVSSGRAYFGIGAGWNDQEAKALGLLDPLHSKRFDRLEDVLKLAHQVWSGDAKPFKGKIYNLPEPYFSPQPVTKPHPPILIGGGGETKTLRFVAEYGDGCNLFSADMDVLRRKLGILKKHCEEIGRNYDEIEKTTLVGLDSTVAANNPDKLIEAAKALSKEGINHIMIRGGKDADPKSYEKLSHTLSVINKL